MYGDHFCQAAFTYKFSISVLGAGRSFNFLGSWAWKLKRIDSKFTYILNPIAYGLADGFLLLKHGRSSLKHASESTPFFQGLPVSFLNFIGVYFLAQMTGFVSQVPGGLGVFETAMLMLFPNSMTATPLLGALIAYRGIYYLLPLSVATAMLGIQELFHGKEKARHF